MGTRAQVLKCQGSAHSTWSGANSTNPPNSCASAQFLKTLPGAMTGRVILKKSLPIRVSQLDCLYCGRYARIPLSRKDLLQSAGTIQGQLLPVSPAEHYFGQGHDLQGQPIIRARARPGYQYLTILA